MSTDNQSPSFVCEVFLCGQQVGWLKRFGGRRTAFEYETSYVANQSAPSLPGLPKSQLLHITHGLPVYFENILPEGWREDVHTLSITRPGEVFPVSGYDILAHHGHKAISTTVVPCKGYDLPSSKRVACEIFAREVKLAKGIIGGHQPKSFVFLNEAGDVFLSGNGQQSTHIAKMTRGRVEHVNEVGIKKITNIPDDVEKEYLATLAVQSLLPDDKTAEVSMAHMVVDGHETRILLTKRFDLDKNGGEIPHFDFCSLLLRPTERKNNDYSSLNGNDYGFYRQMANFIRSRSGADCDAAEDMCTDAADIRKLFRRIVANIIVGNSDTHFKNFSLMLNPDGRWRLSDNYDLVCTIAHGQKTGLLGIGKEAKLTITGVTAQHIVRLGREFELTDDEIRMDMNDMGGRIEQAVRLVRGLEVSITQYGKPVADKMIAHMNERKAALIDKLEQGFSAEDRYHAKREKNKKRKPADTTMHVSL